jgi:hypothetical protein
MIILSKIHKEQPRKRRNYKEALLGLDAVDEEQDASPARLRYSTAYALDRESPSADGKSTVLGSEEPPPCSAVVVDLLSTTISN